MQNIKKRKVNIGFIIFNRPVVRQSVCMEHLGSPRWILCWKFTQVSGHQIKIRLKCDKNERHFV
jgi:hypothetical protein